MGDALLAMLPYTAGLLVSPLPIAAVILLLVSKGGFSKATVFEAAWLIVSFGVVIGLAAIAGNAAPKTPGQTPVWESVLLLVLGVVLLVLTVVVWRAWQRQKGSGGKAQLPHWLASLDDLSSAKVAGLAAVLIVANPVNASMLIAAAVTLGRRHLPAGQNLLPAALFVLIGSATMLLPYVVTVFAGRKTGLLPQARRWLVRYNNAVTFWLTLVVGLIFVIKGVRGLI